MPSFANSFHFSSLRLLPPWRPQRALQVQVEVTVGDPSAHGYYEGVDNGLDAAVAFFAGAGFRELSRECVGGAEWSACEQARLVFCRDGQQCE